MALPLNIPSSVKTLRPQSVVGFDGSIPNGLAKHPGSNTVVYALGPTVVVRRTDQWRGDHDEFLSGHTDTISALAISPDGTRVASGQVAPLGFHATICIFDLSTKQLIHSLNLHRGRVAALSWSSCGTRVASLGGKDDNSVVVWDVVTGRPICGGPAASETALCVAFFRKDPTRFITGGHSGLRVWSVDVVSRRVTPTDIPLGGLTRVIQCLVLSAHDDLLFAGTSSGDVLAVQLNGPHVLRAQGPVPGPSLPQGVTAACLTDDGNVLVGGGAGKIVLLSPELRVLNSVNLQGAITSLVTDPGTPSAGLGGVTYWCGTGRGSIYTVTAKTFKEDLRLTCHSQRVNAVVFPRESSAVFATSSGGDIRVWRTDTGEVLLRLVVPGLECNCLCITNDGGQIVSGWSDGTVRAFGPESGRFLYIIHDAHKVSGMRRVSGQMTGVTAMAGVLDSSRIITGGADGQVRIWSVRQEERLLEATLKEHKGTINSIAVSPSLPEIATASDDGTVIIWDLVRRVRRNVVYAQTYFRSIAYLADGSQFAATGSDRRVTFYAASDCEMIRALEGSKKGEVSALAISPNGMQFVSGGADGILKLWGYDDGNVAAVGNAGRVTGVAFSPDNQFVVAVSADGGVFVFRTPDETLQ